MGIMEHLKKRLTQEGANTFGRLRSSLTYSGKISDFLTYCFGQFFALIVGFIFLSSSVFPQKYYDVNFKVRELKHGTGQPIPEAVVVLDQGKYVGKTDSLGNLPFLQIPAGTHNLVLYEKDHKTFEQDININSNGEIPLSTPATDRKGPWGRDSLVTQWWQNMYGTGPPYTKDKDPPRWKQIIPVSIRLEGITDSGRPGGSLDSLAIISAIDTMEKSTGYDLYRVVPLSARADTTYTAQYTNNNTSWVTGDNRIITSGRSLFTGGQNARITHEIVMAFYGWPLSLPVPTNSEPYDGTRPPWQPINGSYLALTIDQPLAKKRGEQILFMANMQDYTEPSIPNKSKIISPNNNSTGINKIVKFIIAIDRNATQYEIQITKDTTTTPTITKKLDRTNTTDTLEENTTYYARSRATGIKGNGQWSDWTKFTTKSTTSIEISDEVVPNELKLLQNFPNPFNPTTQIRYYLPASTYVKLVVYNSLGQQVADLVDAFEYAGDHLLRFDGSNLTSGIYFITLRAESISLTKKIVLMR